MYHEITTKDKRRKRRRLVMILVTAAVIVALCAVAMSAVSAGTREQGAVALRRSILDAAVRCCAVEGSYPLSLKHLEDSYGLRINHNDYVITYEAYASNIAPSVVVVPR